MTVLSGQSIRARAIFTPHTERTLHAASSLSYGLGPAGYDVRCRETLVLPPGAFALASTLEHFDVPDDLLGLVHDKSTLARRGLAVQNTVIEPGWRGYLTLELSNNHPPCRFYDVVHDSERGLISGEVLRREYDAEHTIRIEAGQPIAQIVLHLLDAPAHKPYAGRYQDQAPRPVGAQPASPGTYDYGAEESSLASAATEMASWK